MGGTEPKRMPRPASWKRRIQLAVWGFGRTMGRSVAHCPWAQHRVPAELHYWGKPLYLTTCMSHEASYFTLLLSIPSDPPTVDYMGCCSSPMVWTVRLCCPESHVPPTTLSMEGFEVHQDRGTTNQWTLTPLVEDIS